MRSPFTRRLLAVGFLAALIAGCNKKAANNANPAVTAAPTATNFGAPPSADECKAFGNKLATAVTANDKPTTDNLFRMDALIDRCVSDLSMSPKDKQSFTRGASQGGGQLTAQIIDQVQKGGKYTFLRVHEVNGRLRALLRLISPEGAVNYHDFTVARYPDNTIAMEDVYVLATGEMMSQTIRRLVLALLAEHNRNLIERLSGGEQLYTKHAGDLMKMNQATRAGKHQQALATYHSLPAELQKNKIFQLAAIAAAQGSGNDEVYMKEMENFRKNHPDDAAVEFVSIDYYTIKKNYDKAVEAINHIEKQIGNDPYLAALRGATYSEAGRTKEAKAEVEKAIAAEPNLDLIYGLRISIALKAMDNVDALKWLKKMSKGCGIELDPEGLKNNEEYAMFVKSPQFKELKAWVADPKKP